MKNTAWVYLESAELLNMSTVDYIWAVALLHHRVESKRRDYVHILVDLNSVLLLPFMPCGDRQSGGHYNGHYKLLSVFIPHIET